MSSPELPRLRIKYGDQELLATPLNSSVYKHLGNLACYDHVFFEQSEQKNGLVKGSYMFACHSVHEEVEQFMIQNGYPLHVNLTRVALNDMKAYDDMI